AIRSERCAASDWNTCARSLESAFQTGPIGFRVPMEASSQISSGVRIGTGFQHLTNYHPNRSLTLASVSLILQSSIIRHGGPEHSKLSFIGSKKSPASFRWPGGSQSSTEGGPADGYLRQNAYRKFKLREDQ
ncbi:hypothetical protein, partial [Bradyrhizobium ottawaense]|uniref:hypothetical protein n=1 Tax=Bradyrhizobium ottawaense TaxID=931866 RepID=UPI001AECFFDA